MNKVLNINLGGMPFTIDEDAYAHLRTYLKAIHQHFRNSEGYEEITADIEARMAELFQEKLGNRPIVTLTDVKHVIAIMGTPEDFGAESISEEAPKSDSGNRWKLKTGKRLFRNPDDCVVGGVCSGIAAYFGIEDPVWVRLAFILLTVSGGFGIPLYLVLWAVLPEAKTASDRLAMRGEPANVSNIGRIIEEELSHVSKMMGELGEELKAEFSKKKSKKQQYADAPKNTQEAGGQEEGDDDDDPGLTFRNAASEGLHFLGAIFKNAAALLAAILRPLAYATGIALILILAVFWMVTVGMLFFGIPFAVFLGPDPQYLTTLGIFNVLFLVGIPVLMGILMVMRIFMKTYFKPRWAAGLWIFWLVNVVGFFFVAAKTANDFSAGAEASIPLAADLHSLDTLVLEFSENPYAASWMRFGDRLYVSDDKLISSNIGLTVVKSESGDFKVYQKRSARGSTPEKAEKQAEEIHFDYTVEGNRLKVPSYFALDKGEKWRAQEVELVIEVPEGKYLRFEGRNPRGPRHLETDHNYSFPHHLSGYTAMMTSNGLISRQYLMEDDHYHWIDGVTKVQGRGALSFEIVKGELPVAFIEMGETYTDEVSFQKKGSELLVSTDYNASRPIVIKVILPSLSALEFTNTGDVEISGFDLATLTLRSEGDQEIKADFNVKNLNVALTGDQALRLSGEGLKLNARLSGDVELDAKDYKVKTADVVMEGNCYARLAVTDTLYQRLCEDCSLELLHSPVVVNR